MLYKSTLCYKCGLAGGENSGCPWMKDYTPVEGWDAIWDEKIGSYNVTTCPMFTKMRTKELDDKGVRNLSLSALRVHLEDYADGAYDYYATGERTERFINAAIWLATPLAEEMADAVEMDIDYLVQNAKATAKELWEQPVLTPEQIRRYRKKRGLTAKDLGEIMHRDGGYILDIENGRRKRVKAKELRMIARALDLTDEEKEEIK